MHQQTAITPDATGRRAGLVVSAYHGTVTRRLRDGAVAAFVAAGGCEDDLIEASVPGTFELPVIAAALAARDDIDLVVACGCVIAGETSHDQFINHSVAHALQRVAVQYGKPVAFGVLTCQSLDQAVERAGGGKGNKGTEGMNAAIITFAALRGCQTGAAVSTARREGSR